MPTSQGYVGIIRGVAVGSFGQTLSITLKDLDGTAQDLSSYSSGTGTAYGLSPDGRRTVNSSLTFSDAANGVVTWTWASGDIDRPGDWEVQLVFTNAGSTARIKTFIAKMPVIPGIAEV
jgi:hypothetical protein